ncbi:hypothetical protein I5677_15710 [Mobilitalea sibirica]|uniref:Uncharacterized protein n=1 Tax=Mobilitalea sibirica TaxID=1462919 RepID=A0A8J7L0G9_9FIRM|nr:hypothetical protein [Mobilitalea sibirica]MBH1942348.1 hypothetical protein [Mobilitalea sibirica]
MENTIVKLFEIEEKANLIIKRANEEKIRLHDAFEQDIKRMEEKVAADNYNKIRNFQLQTDKELTKEKKSITEKSEKHLIELDDIYKEHHKDFVDKVFENIIMS